MNMDSTSLSIALYAVTALLSLSLSLCRKRSSLRKGEREDSYFKQGRKAKGPILTLPAELTFA